jgi:hypothetical protein
MVLPLELYVAYFEKKIGLLLRAISEITSFLDLSYLWPTFLNLYRSIS